MGTIDKKEAHKVFGEVWKMFNTVRKNDTDDGWKACMDEANRIHAEYPSEFYKTVVLAVVAEAEREARLNPSDRQKEYKNAGTVFQAAWKMFVTFADDIESFKASGMTALSDFNVKFSGKFAEKMGSAVYEALCRAANDKGSFMTDAFSVYQEFQGGISDKSEAEAYKKAENIINVHPEHMLQMMNLYADLRAAAR